MTTTDPLHPRIKNGTFTDRTFTPSPLTFTAGDINHGGGYDDVQVNENGTTSYTKDDVGHRENGFAVEYKNGGGYYMLDGEFVHEPDGGELGLELRYVTDGTQYWSAEVDGHSVEAWRSADHTVEFYRDGVLSRTGEPAVTRADGSEEWWVDGVHYPDAIPAPGVGSGMDQGQYTTAVGAKYDRATSIAEIVKSLRADMAVAQTVGIIPAAATFTVTRPNGTVTIQVRGLADLDVYTFDENRRGRYTEKTRKMLDRLQKIGDAYSRSTTDVMTDYFNYSHYTFVEVEDEFSARYRAKEAAAAKAARAAKSATRP